jgi:hypothetical protein
METSSQELALGVLLLGCSLPIGFSLFAVVVLRLRHARIVGARLGFQRSARAWMFVAWTAQAVALAAIVVSWEALPVFPALNLLVLASALFALSPGAQDAEVGEGGVRHGWSARTLTELEEWRLTGEHLRWKVRGEWVACHVAPERHARLRSLLSQACPERESAFRD